MAYSSMDQFGIVSPPKKKVIPSMSNLISGFGGGSNSAQVAKNTTSYPLTSPGGGPTYDSMSSWPSGDPSIQAPDLSAPAAPPRAPFDYNSALANDPLWLQLQSNLSAQGISNAADRKANTNQALIKFGEVPNFTDALNGFGLDPNSGLYQTLMGDISPETSTSAQALTNAGYSTLGGLNTTHQKALGDLMDTLAAHGTVRSGATRVGSDLENQAYGKNQFDARQSLLSYLTGLQQAYAQGQQGIQSQLATGAQDAVNRQLSLYQTGNQ